MGNQLAATPTVDLANVSPNLELIAPLGAEGRNYFATFHCLYYAPLSATPSTTLGGTTGASTASPLPNTISSSSVNNNAPGCTAEFLSVDGTGSRPDYRLNRVYYPSAGSVGSGAGGGRHASTLSGVWGRDATSSALPTTQIKPTERAAWHQARWRQRLPVAARPWRVVPAHFASEASSDRCPAGDVMDRWYRDSTVASTAFSNSSAGRFEGQSRACGPALTSLPSPPPPPQQQLRSPPLSPSLLLSSVGGGRGSTASATDIDATVAGVVGEWRSNYGNYVQLLLRCGGGGGGGGANYGTVVSAALCDGQTVRMADPAQRAAVDARSGVGYGARSAFTAAVTMTVPSALSGGVTHNSSVNGGDVNGSSVRLQSFKIHDVVTKVFVRTQDDPGQTYFLKRVRQMMDSAKEQLSVIDSTLAATTPRSCLWYTLAYEGDGFCVLQRPYVAFTLRERLAARPGWAATEKLFIAFQILQAVAHLHDTYGLTHGDIKPNNVLVQSTGIVVLCDMAPFKPCRLPSDSPLLFDYYYDTDESRACYVAPEKFSDQPLPSPPLESKTPGSATYNVDNLNFDSHTASMDVFSAACVLLFLYKEEDPFTLSEVLNLHHLTSAQARENLVRPVLTGSGVPPPLQPLLHTMLCSSSADRPSAREVLTRGLETHVFPASFAFLHHDVLPRLLTQSPDVQLRLLQNRLEDILQHGAQLDAPSLKGCKGPSTDVRGAESNTAHDDSIDTNARLRATTVCVLLPLLLQTIHSTKTSDEATFRGLLCLRHCVSYCSFDCLTDFILPHLVFLVNNDAHVYGAPTRLVAIRLLCRVVETVARQLTEPSHWEEAPNFQKPADEEQWALMEHLVLPCLYDVLRQGEQESVAVLVELAERLPRLLLLTRFLTERRQVLYGAEVNPAAAAQASKGSVPSALSDRPGGASTNVDSAKEVVAAELSQTAVPPVASHPSSDVKQRDAKSTGVGGGPVTSLPAPQPVSSGGKSSWPTSRDYDGEAGLVGGVCGTDVSSVCSSATQRDVGSVSETSLHTLDSSEEAMLETDKQNAPGSSVGGAVQYLAQLRCLLSNGWSMLQMLYNHPSVAVGATMMQQTTSTVAAFLGEDRVVEDLIPLLTTALTAPLRVLRHLFPQAIILHVLLQKPQTKTLHLFVEEGLRQSDDVCLKSTLDSVAVVVRSGRLPLAESMALVHQTLPFLMDTRLWLREAACGVVEAAAQSCPPSAVALHLEYAVRPLLTHPVPLSQLRRFAASIIRSEMAATRFSANGTAAVCDGREGGFRADTERGFAWSFDDPPHVVDVSAPGVFLENSINSCGADGSTTSWSVDYRNVLPSVVAAAVPSAAAASAPVLLHLLPPPNAPATTAFSSSANTTVLPPQTIEAAAGAPPPLLAYRLAAREAARMKAEVSGSAAAAKDALDSCSSPLDATAPAAADRAGAFTALALLQGPLRPPVATPRVVGLSPLPSTLAVHSSTCRSELPAVPGHAGATAYRSPWARPPSPAPPLPSASAAAAPAASFQHQLRGGQPSSSGLPSTVGPISFSALRPIAAPLSSLSGHMGAIYTAAAAPSAKGVVLTAGTRGEAVVWRVSTAAHSCDITLVERAPVPLPMRAFCGGASSSALQNFSYVSSQWMDVPLQRHDNSGGAASAASTITVALAATDGVVRLLDVERNAWLWSTAVGEGMEGAAVGLAVQDRCCLLAVTAGGGLHVVDTRCRGSCVTDSSYHSVSAVTTTSKHTSPSAGGSVWRACLNPLDGAPSSLLPLYAGDRACAAVVATYDGVVCLFDLRYKLCAQRTVMTTTSPLCGVSQPISITCACVDPLSSLCRVCRPESSWEPAVPGPSVLLGTTAGTVYRLLLQSNCLGAYWPTFECNSDEECRGGGVRSMLTQPSNGSVFTGSEDGYIRHWSTDRPEASHTMTCAPYTSPPYTVTRFPSKRSVGQSGSALAAEYGTKRLAMLTVRAGGDGGAQHALPHHAPDAILTLSAVQMAASSTTWSAASDGHSYLLSGARDGSLTLWNNVE
jgi:phosphoinositide-3-kinase, regulatory subunit 4